MKKKNSNLTKVVILMLIVTMLALIAISGTYAKYTTTVNGTGTAIIGKWDINLEDATAQPLQENFNIDLADTITGGSEDNFIQPGSSGSFTITVNNDGDVPAKVTASLGNEYTSIFKQGQFSISITAPEGAGDGVTIEPASSQDVTITWAWEYNKDSTGTADEDDTTIGSTSDRSAETICEITLTATQINPTGV